MGATSATTPVASGFRALAQRLRGRRWLRQLPWVLTLATLAWLVLLPLVQLQSRALDDGAASYSQMFSSGDFYPILINTALLAVGSVTVAVVTGTFLAWSAMQLPSRARLLMVLPLLPIMIPPVASVSGWAFLLSPRVGYANVALRNLPWWQGLETGPLNAYSMPTIVVVTGVILVGFVYLFMMTALRSLDGSVIEAARVSGSGAIRTFWTIVLPMLRPALVYSSAIVLLLGLGQFTAPLLLGRQASIDVLTTEMYRSAQTFPIDYGYAAAFGSPLVLAGIVLIMIQKGALRNRARFEGVGVRGHRPETRRLRWPIIPLITYVSVAVVLPLLALVVVALSPFYSGTIDVSTMGLDNFREVLGSHVARGAIWNSLWASFLALVIVVPLSYIVATSIVATRGPSRTVRTAIDLLVNTPLAMPAVLFGAGILFAYSEGPIVLYGSAAGLVLAYVTLMVPHATRMQMAGLIAVGESLAVASRVHGAGALRTHLRVILPSIRHSIAGAAAIVLALLTHEFAASVMIRSTGTEVMGTLLFEYWSTGSFPTVAVMALVMCAVTATAVSLALLVGGKGALENV